jgi:DNA-binding NarL/FixJ family response regulator
MAKISVLIADDHAVLRDGLRALLSLYDDIEVVGEAADGVETVEEVERLRPDVVLMDIAMPRLGGLEATLELRQRKLPTKVLILTQHENKEYIYPILKAGAVGYLLKKAAGTELVSAIRAVYAGESYLYPSVARAVVEQYVGRGPGEAVSAYDRLTDREKEVLKLIAEGRSNKEIADLLVLSVKTVMSHRARLMEKLDVHSRTDLVKFAIRMGLVDVGR